MIKIFSAYLAVMLSIMATVVYAPREWMEEQVQHLLFLLYSDTTAFFGTIILLLLLTHIAAYFVGRLDNRRENNPFSVDES